MIKRRNRARDESTIDITPMLDIVFIMLIFFIVTGKNEIYCRVRVF